MRDSGDISHTPEPWKMRAPLLGDKSIEITGDTNFYHGGTIAVIPRDDCDHDEALANGQLVTQSPALYRMLKKVVPFLPVDSTLRLEVSMVIDKVEGR